MYGAYRSKAGDCEICTQREGYTRKKGKKGKRKYLNIPLKAQRRNYSQEMGVKMDPEQGREIYPHRMKIVELIFANINTKAVGLLYPER